MSTVARTVGTMARLSGAEFEPRTSGKYCCAECRRVAKARQDREHMARRRGAPRTYEPRTCDVCGREFTPHSYQQLRCSPDCMYEANLRRGRETYRRERERAMAEAEKLRMRDEWRRWRNGVETLRAMRA